VPICFSAKDHGADAGVLAPTLRAGAHADSHANAGVMPAITSGMQVRRLTPRECERLQGFPDNWTLIPGKAARLVEADMLAYLRAWRPDLTEAEAQRLAADGPRYKALGNSWAVPCAHWLGERIAAVDALALDRREVA
jgi:DNA (cytosine-5)-methyltransferase 1